MHCAMFKYFNAMHCTMFKYYTNIGWPVADSLKQ